MKKLALQIAVVAGLVVAAFVFRGRDSSTQTEQTIESPNSQQTSRNLDFSGASATVNAFFNAASEGDDDTYLRLVSGNLRKSLEESRSELGTEAFRAELRRSAAGIKGLATEPAEGAPGEMVAVDVEIVFADRNERQRMLLAPRGNDWVITSIERVRMIEPVVPYGTPVFGEQSPQDAVEPQSP